MFVRDGAEVAVDTTLSEAGKAADAAATGEAIASLSEEISELDPEYELFATVTIEDENVKIVRKDYPEGLSAVKLTVQTTAGTATINGVVGIRAANGNVLAENPIGAIVATAPKKGGIKTIIKNGLMYKTIYNASGVIYGNIIGEACDKVTMVQVYLQGNNVFPVGTIVEFWGVRADV